MMKKLLLPLMLMLATIAVVPGNSNKIIKANAEETTSDVTNKSKKVEKGYITNNLVNESGIVDLTNSDTLNKFNSNAFSSVTLKPISYDDSMFKNTFLKYTEAGKVLNGPNVVGSVKKTQYAYGVSDDDYNNTQWGLTSLVATRPYDSTNIIKERFFTIKYGLDYVFSDWDKTKEQPLELIIPISLSDIETGIKRCFPFTLSADVAPKVGTKVEQTFPIISINGYDYFTATFKYIRTVSGPKVSITYSTNNARAYIAYGQGSTYAGYVCLEIPFTSYLQTISIAKYIKTVNDLHTSEPRRTRMIQISSEAYKSKFKAPIVITDLDFKKGTTTTITSNSVYVNSKNEESIYAVETDYVRLDSLVIDNKYTLYTKRTGEHPTPREDLYELYIDNEYKTRFTYEANNELAKTLRENESGQKVTITKYNYSILRKETETSFEYATTTDFVDCGNFYAFKKINKDQIHTVTFNALKDTGRGSMVDRLAFSAYDDTTNLKITKISAIMFYYSFYYNYDPHYDNGKVYNLSISAQDLIDGGVESGNKEVFWHWLKDSTGNIIHKKDKFGTQFFLTGLKKSDYKYFNWDGASDEIKKADKSDMFLIGNKGVNGVRVTFESIISCVYIDKNGDLINCSSVFPNGINAPTAIIDDDGKVTLIDGRGNVIPGTVNPDTGVLVMPDGNPYEPPDNIVNPKPTNILDELRKAIQKICAVLGTIAIVGGAFWVFSKVGPTIAVIVKKKKE